MKLYRTEKAEEPETKEAPPATGDELFFPQLPFDESQFRTTASLPPGRVLRSGCPGSVTPGSLERGGCVLSPPGKYRGPC